MRLRSRAASFIALPGHRKRTLLEALWWGIVAFALIELVPFRLWAPIVLGKPRAPENVTTIGGPVEPVTREVQWAVRHAGRLMPQTMRCLAQAIAGRAMLRRRDVASVLVLGVKPGVAVPEGRQLTAHAWLCVGYAVLLGDSERAGHIAVASYPSRLQPASTRPIATP